VRGLFAKRKNAPETDLEGIVAKKCARALTGSKDDGLSTTEYVPGSSEVDEAMAARRAFKQMISHGHAIRLPAPAEQT
jgi:hypothetical protein